MAGAPGALFSHTARKPAYSQAPNQSKIYRQRSRSGESGRQTIRRLSWWMVLGVEMGREVWWRGWIRIGFAKEQCFQFKSERAEELWQGERFEFATPEAPAGFWPK